MAAASYATAPVAGAGGWAPRLRQVILRNQRFARMDAWPDAGDRPCGARSADARLPGRVGNRLGQFDAARAAAWDQSGGGRRGRPLSANSPRQARRRAGGSCFAWPDRGCSLLLCTQRPALVGYDVRSQANRIVVYRLTADEDLKAIVSVCPELRGREDEIRTLPVGRALVWDDKNGVYPPAAE